MLDGQIVRDDHGLARHRLTPYWRHFAEMFAVMVVGMVGAAVVFCFSIGMTWDHALTRHPAASLIVVAGGMSVPMFAWMAYRGMGLRNALEMAGAMAVPVLPFLGLVWLNVTKGAACGLYCVVSVLAMLGLMRFRYDVYSMEMAHH